MADHPNIVLIMCDDLGYGDTGFNGSPVIRTPHLDARRAEGARFTRFYAGGPLCSDNGPEGSEDLTRNGRNQGSIGGLRGRKRSLFDDGIGVPTLVKWPRYVDPLHPQCAHSCKTSSPPAAAVTTAETTSNPTPPSPPSRRSPAPGNPTQGRNHEQCASQHRRHQDRPPAS